MTALKLSTSSLRKLKTPIPPEKLVEWARSHIYFKQCQLRAHYRLA